MLAREGGTDQVAGLRGAAAEHQVGRNPYRNAVRVRADRPRIAFAQPAGITDVAFSQTARFRSPSDVSARPGELRGSSVGQVLAKTIELMYEQHVMQ
jgi:hypothetical protein